MLVFYKTKLPTHDFVLWPTCMPALLAANADEARLALFHAATKLVACIAFVHATCTEQLLEHMLPDNRDVRGDSSLEHNQFWLFAAFTTCRSQPIVDEVFCTKGATKHEHFQTAAAFMDE